jgi:hypothetical protein
MCGAQAAIARAMNRLERLRRLIAFPRRQYFSQMMDTRALTFGFYGSDREDIRPQAGCVVLSQPTSLPFDCPLIPRACSTVVTTYLIWNGFRIMSANRCLLAIR